MLAASRPPGTLSMYTRRNRCLPTFHSTSTISRPSERATRSAAPRIFSKSTQRLPDHSRSAVHSNRRQQKSGLAPTHGATRFRAKIEYIPAARQKQDTAPGSAILLNGVLFPLFAVEGLQTHVFLKTGLSLLFRSGSQIGRAHL